MLAADSARNAVMQVELLKYLQPIQQPLPEPISKVIKQRPDDSETKIPLKLTVTQSAKSALEKKLSSLSIEEESSEGKQC